MKKIELKIILKNLSRNKLHSLINIIGFAIGIAVFIFIVLYANHKLSYDKLHTQHDNIYKLCIGDFEEIPAPIANQIAANFPEIENYNRIADWYGGGDDGVIKINHTVLKVDNLIFSDSSFFNFFDFGLRSDKTVKDFQEPNTIILSKNLSKWNT